MSYVTAFVDRDNTEFELYATLGNVTATAEGLAAGEDPTVEAETDGIDVSFAFGIPKGDKGDQGIQGIEGPTGNGIESITFDAQNVLSITTTDEQTVTFDGIKDAITAAGTATTNANNAATSANTAAAAANELVYVVDALQEGNQLINGDFSYGVFENNYPDSDPRKFNAVTMQAEKFNRDITLKAINGYNFLVYFYNDSDVYVSKSANWEKTRDVPANTKFRIWVRQEVLDTSVVLDLTEVKNSIVFKTIIGSEVITNTKNIALNKENIKFCGDGLQLIDESFVWGNMNTSTGAAVIDSSYKYQVITPNLIKYDSDVNIICNDNYEFQAYWYDSEDTYISRTGSFVKSYKMSSDKYFRLFVRLDPPNNQVIVQPDVFKNNIYIKTKTEEQINSLKNEPLSTMPNYMINSLADKKVGQLSKGYILLSCDDGTEGLATYTIPMLAQKEVPCTFGLLSTSIVITNQTYLATLLDALDHGCCVAMHGSTQWPTLSESELTKYFETTENVFESAGITEVHGAICPGGAGADTNKLVQAVAGGRYGSVFSGGIQGEIKYGNYNAVGARTNMYAMARYSAISFTQATYQEAIDDAYDNHYILCPFWHDYTIVDNASYKAIIEGMIDYAKTKGLEFITMEDLLKLK